MMEKNLPSIPAKSGGLVIFSELIADPLSAISQYYHRLFLHRYPLPERDVIFDIGGSVFRAGVEPGGIFILFTIYLEVIIRSLTFPGTGSLMVAWFKILRIEGFCREIMIVLDYDGFITFGDFFSVPDCFMLFHF